MKITALETIRNAEFPNLLWLHIHTDEGISGLGETFFGAQAVEAYLHESVAPQLLGQDPGRIDYIARKLYGYLGFRGSGVETRGNSAIDIALWDLWGKRTGQPVYQLLGGLTREQVRVYNTCAGYRYVRQRPVQTTDNWGLDGEEGPYEDLDAFLNRADELALSLLQQGIQAMKIWPFDHAAENNGGLHISPAELRRALEPFEKIRKAVGDKMDIMVEFHSLWNLPTACRIAEAVKPFQPYWMEDPVKMDSLSVVGEYRQRTGLTVTASETLSYRTGYKDLLEAKAVDIVMPDLSWCGGISEAKKIATMVEAYQLPVAPHDCTGPVVLTASSHLSLNAPNALLQETVRAFYTGWYKEIVTALPIIEEGYLRLEPNPGLGLELLPDFLKRNDTYRKRSEL
ncbi:MAG: mandelate racemase/muconate lactonizing enzyme family protein [SAR324 cluster bacterium]|nr:mandelate racemase/muconate lactonizing enzyme family protein [SAR324 cluster bacterium]